MKYIVVLMLLGLFFGCGKQGDTGAAGPKGDGQITSELYCSSAVDSNVNVSFRYERVVYSTGDSAMKCVVDTNIGSYSNSIWRKSTDVQSPYSCDVIADIDTASRGLWTLHLNTDSGKVTATYQDTGSSKNGYQYEFATSECTTY